MQILLALIFGAVVGIAAHFVVSGRETRGVALAPILGALVGGAVWMILTWAGLTITDVWLWLAAAVAPAIVVFPTLLVLTRARVAHDANEKARLGLV